jgi:hypothetical protein
VWPGESRELGIGRLAGELSGAVSTLEGPVAEQLSTELKELQKEVSILKAQIADLRISITENLSGFSQDFDHS